MGTLGMMRGLALAACIVVVGCAAPPSAPVASQSTAAVPQKLAPPTVSELTADPRAADRCGAAGLQYLVGRPKTEIPIPVSPGARRVICTTCPMTRDYREDRQTILFDLSTGLVTSVACD
jgi:hypothetical protein